MVPDDSYKTRRLRISKTTLRLLIATMALIIPLLIFSFILIVHFQNGLLTAKKQLLEERQLVEQKEFLTSRLSTLERSVGRSEQAIKKLESVLDVELGQLQSGLGPIDHDGVLDKKIKEIPQVVSSMVAIEEGDGFSHDFIREKISNLDQRLTTLRSKVGEIYQLNADKLRFLEATPNSMPVEGWITSAFGFRVSPYSGTYKMHYGLDIASPVGTLIKAPAAGKVVMADYTGGYGRKVVIEHGFGVNTIYGHASAIYVKEGDRVKKGDAIAAVGSTGESTGPHLHYEVHVDGIPTDPVNYLIN